MPEEKPLEEGALEEEVIEEPGEETPAEETVETPPEEAAEIEEKPELPEKYGEKVQKRIDKLTKSMREAEREAAYWRGVAEQKDKPEEKPLPGTAPKPREEDFEDHTEFVEALTDWKVEQKREQWRREDNEAAEKAQLDEAQDDFFVKMGEGRERYDDFDEVVFAPTNPINPVMADILRGTEIPADIAYYLGSHLPECQTISRMTGPQAARAIGRIEERLLAAQKNKPKPKTTNAPPPVKPVGAGGDVIDKKPEDMTMEEYTAARREGKI